MRRIPVGIRARAYRGTVAVAGAAIFASIALAAFHQPFAAFVVAASAGALGTVSAVLAAANTPLDFRP